MWDLLRERRARADQHYCHNLIRPEARKPFISSYYVREIAQLRFDVDERSHAAVAPGAAGCDATRRGKKVPSVIHIAQMTWQSRGGFFQLRPLKRRH